MILAKKKKQTKEQRLAKARAYAKKMTHGKVMDAVGIAGAAGRTALFAQKNPSRAQDALGWNSSFYGGYDMKAQQLNLSALVRGYGGTVNRSLEKAWFRFLGIKGPRSEVKTLGDAIDYATYHGAAATKAYANKEDLELAFVAWYKTHYGIDLLAGGYEAYQPVEMIYEKIIPYSVQKKVRQIPFVKNAISKVNFF